MLKANGIKARNCFFWLSLPLASQCEKFVEELWSLTNYNSNNNNDDNYNDKITIIRRRRRRKRRSMRGGEWYSHKKVWRQWPHLRVCIFPEPAVESRSWWSTSLRWSTKVYLKSTLRYAISDNFSEMKLGDEAYRKALSWGWTPRYRNELHACLPLRQA